MLSFVGGMTLTIRILNSIISLTLQKLTTVLLATLDSNPRMKVSVASLC